jgi:hypothetical protein
MAQKTRNFWWDFGGQEWLGLGEIRFGIEIFSDENPTWACPKVRGKLYGKPPPVIPWFLRKMFPLKKK